MSEEDWGDFSTFEARMLLLLIASLLLPHHKRL
jgi:hypothetical protein